MQCLQLMFLFLQTNEVQQVMYQTLMFQRVLICIYDAFKEKCIFFHIGVLWWLQFGQREEGGAAAGNIHVVHRSLKGSRSQVWAKSINNVFSVVLVKQHKCNLKSRRQQWWVTEPKIKQKMLEKTCKRCESSWMLYWQLNASCKERLTAYKVD